MWMLIYIYIYIPSLLPIQKKKQTNKQTHAGSPVHLLGQTFQLCLNNGNNISFYLLHSYNYINISLQLYPTNHSFPLQSTFSLSLHLIDLDNVIHPQHILKVLSLLLFITLCEFSVFFKKNLYFILILSTIYICFLFNFCLNVGKQWKRGETLNFYLGFFCFPILYLNFSSCSQKL